MTEAPTEAPSKQGGMRTFTTIWVGQLVSLIGSGLTSFALGIWILENTESVTQFTLAIVMASLPGTFLSPIAGAYVDRWDRRWVMILSDLGPAVVTLTFAGLLYFDALEVWHIYIGIVVNSVFSAFQWPAFISSITLLVKKENYARVQGLLQFGNSATTIAAPALAGLLMLTINLWGVLIVDFVTFLFAVVALLLVRIPKPPLTEEGQRNKGSIWKEAAYGWTYIVKRKGLLYLLLFFAAINLVTSMCGIAIVPMVFAFANEAGAGLIFALFGVGGLLGGALMAATGGPKKKINGVLGAAALYSVCFVLIGLRPSLWLVGAGVILWHTAVPVMNACSQAIWQAKVAPDVQGRVFAMRRMIAQFTVPIGDFSAGPLADYVFNPMMMAGGALAASVGTVIGVGEGRGIGLMFLTFAIVPALIALVGYMNPHIRNVETELPDHVATESGPAPGPDDDPEEEADDT